MLKGIKLVDRIQVPSERTLTDAGQMHVPCKFARTGVQLYTAKQLKLDGVEPNKLISVYRDEADVFAEDSMDSFRSAPVTIGHPKRDGKDIKVSAENAKELQVGMLEGMPARDEDTLGGTLILTAQEAIDALEDGTQELSAGYVCDIEEIDGKYFQRNIRANHIAIVAKGRAGSSCRISDAAEDHLGEAYEAIQVELGDAAEREAVLGTKLEAAELLVADGIAKAEKVEIELEKLKLELTDAKVAATESVVLRCETIENARLIADMRDLGDKSVAEIHLLVVKDQMPSKDLTGKSEDFVAAMFEILVDASNSETPMGKLLRQNDINVNDGKKETVRVDIVKEARQRSIDRSHKA